MLPTLLPFATLPVTILVIVSYLASIISTVVIQERLPAAPSHRNHSPGLDLNEAWKDLQHLARVAHPFNSRENDEVGAYIANRLKRIQNGTEHVQIDVDLSTNTTWYSGNSGVTYMESRNIIAKFDGSKYNDSAVLFTAHYDTNSLAPGATDDSIAVASLLQVADYLADKQPERTIILLFDDGEEDGLHGSHVFLRHPWAALVQSFVNIEGAGAGGRPNLFRSSSAQITQAFKTTAHPHGSSLFNDAWNLGLIRSRTDYDVYTRAGIPGVDYAFYARRQKYHTMDDTISSLHDRRPLWSMVENLYGVVEKLSGESNPNDSHDTHFVYFDLFGEDMFYLRFDFFLILNILLVLLSPIAVGLLVYSLHYSRKLYFGWKGVGRFFMGLLFGAILGGVCAAWYREYNPFIIHKSPYLVLITIACMTIIGALLPSHLAARWSPVPVQTGQVLVEMSAFWWLIAIANTVVSARNTLGGSYFITFFFAAAVSATLVSLLDMHRLDPKPGPVPGSLEEQTGEEVHQHGGAHDEENATERTPLLPAEEVLSPKKVGEERLGWIWVLEFVLVAVFPAVIMLQIMLSLLAALSPTLVDGSKPLFVYTIVSLTVLLTVLPVIPFAHKLPLTLFGILFLFAVATTLYTTLDFPFSPEDPLKLFFGQRVDLDAGKTNITLAGVRPYLTRVLNELPSVESDEVTWASTIRPGIAAAEFPGQLPRSVPKKAVGDWLNFTAKKTSISSVLIRVQGLETRYCTLDFEGGYNVSQVVVRGSNTHGYQLPAPRPVKHVDLYKRTWDGVWEVELELTTNDSLQGVDVASVLSGKVACIWSDRRNGKIPALDELYVYFPTWATMTATSRGLVEGWKRFSV